MYLEKFKLGRPGRRRHRRRPGDRARLFGGARGSRRQDHHRRPRCQGGRGRLRQPPAKGYRGRGRILDVTDSRRVSEIADELASRHGKIDILVNNAGIARSETPAEQVTDEHWLNVVDVNLNGTFWCCRAFGKHMLAAKSGAIVNIGSMSGFIVNKPQEQCYYNASKAAVHHLTKSLAAEWGARGVRVNAVAPTYVATPLNAFVKNNPQMYDAWIGGTPMARMGEVDEIASVVLFLASDAASLMTGASFSSMEAIRAGRLRSSNGIGMRQAFIGVDVGTSSARAGVFDETGTLLATARSRSRSGTKLATWSNNRRPRSGPHASPRFAPRWRKRPCRLPPSRAWDSMRRARSCVLDAAANPLTVSTFGRRAAQCHRLDGPSRQHRGPCCQRYPRRRPSLCRRLDFA